MPPLADSGRSASAAIFALCQRLLEADPRTRLVFTTREPLPAPFDRSGGSGSSGALGRSDADRAGRRGHETARLDPARRRTPGETPQEITDLVEAVNRHARALVLLAREVAQRGRHRDHPDLRSLMADLERKHPGDRENSLYASVELSLRRLPPGSRQEVRALAVCHGGLHLWVLAVLTGLESDAATRLAGELIEVGLGEDMGDGHLRLDPGLAPYLLGEMAADEAEALRARWVDCMVVLTGFLYEQTVKNVQRVRRLTLLELPNLLAMLDLLPAGRPAEDVVRVASNVESLLQPLGQPRALAQATRIRELAAQDLGGWSHARYRADASHIDRLLDRGDFPAAYAAAQQLLTQSTAAGETAYPGAFYDIAMVYFRLGRVLEMVGAAETALAPLAEAQRRFQQLADQGNESADRMASATFTEIGDCLRDLGRLESAAESYAEAIRRGLRHGDLRAAAVDKSQLGAVRMLQDRYDEALQSYREARDTFEALGEARMVAAVWHQIGMLHKRAGNYEASEQANRESLAIEVREGNLTGQAASLVELGNLYSEMGRDEEAATFSSQGAELYVRLEDLAGEGRARNNLAHTLAKLRRYDEARQEVQRAIVCKEPYGHAAEAWTTWAILERIEQATGHAAEARAARIRAMDTYLAYRRAGGESRARLAELFALVAGAIQQDSRDHAIELLDEVPKENLPPWSSALIRKLRSILTGHHDPAIAADPELSYVDAAELQYLLEKLD